MSLKNLMIWKVLSIATVLESFHSAKLQTQTLQVSMEPSFAELHIQYGSHPPTVTKLHLVRIKCSLVGIKKFHKCKICTGFQRLGMKN